MHFDPRIFRQAHKWYIDNYKLDEPDYTIEFQKISRLADFRNLLYTNTFDSILSQNSLSFNFTHQMKLLSLQFLLKELMKMVP